MTFLLIALSLSLLVNLAQMASYFDLKDRWRYCADKKMMLENDVHSLEKRLEPFKAYEDQVSR